MARRIPTHYAVGTSMNLAVCGKSGALLFTSMDRASVTCPQCKRRIRELEAAHG